MVVIKLPICQDTFSTDQTNDVSQVSFLNGVMHDLNRQMIEYRPFLLGYATTATRLDINLGFNVTYNAAVVANLYLTAPETVRKQTGVDTSMSVRRFQ